MDVQRPSISQGLGLVNIKERTRLVNGTLNLESSRGRGTRLRITVPLLSPLRTGPAPPRRSAGAEQLNAVAGSSDAAVSAVLPILPEEFRHVFIYLSCLGMSRIILAFCPPAKDDSVRSNGSTVAGLTMDEAAYAA